MKFAALVAVFAAAALGLAAQAQAPASAAAPAKRIVLLVDEYKAIRNFPIIVAERLGYLNDGDMIVTVMNIRDDIPTAQMLMDGRVDAVMAYYHHNIVNRSEGRNLEAIVTLGVTPGDKVLVATQASERVKADPGIAQHLANAFVRTLKYINSHTPEEILAVIPVEVSGKDRAAYLQVLKEEIPMFANDGRMPPEDAAREWRVLSEFN